VRAIVYHGPKDFRVEQIADPKLLDAPIGRFLLSSLGQRG
jgi:hypothetical protein